MNKAAVVTRWMPRAPRGLECVSIGGERNGPAFNTNMPSDSSEQTALNVLSSLSH